MGHESEDVGACERRARVEGAHGAVGVVRGARGAGAERGAVQVVWEKRGAVVLCVGRWDAAVLFHVDVVRGDTRANGARDVDRAQTREERVEERWVCGLAVGNYLQAGLLMFEGAQGRGVGRHIITLDSFVRALRSPPASCSCTCTVALGARRGAAS